MGSETLRGQLLCRLRLARDATEAIATYNRMQMLELRPIWLLARRECSNKPRENLPLFSVPRND
jgi:hypothetical protein